MNEYYVFWKEKDSEVINKTFIVAENEEQACNKIALIKGKNKIEILYTEDGDRSQKNKSIDFLTKESVSITTVNDKGFWNNQVYKNTVSGRESLIENESEEIVAEVLAVWGDEPIVEEPTYDNVPNVPTPPSQEQSANIWDEMADAIKQGVNEV